MKAPKCGARPAGVRRGPRCGRPATWEAFFLGAWLPLCRYHVGAYYDLARHRLTR